MSLKPLIEHHAERAARGVAYNAIANCHAEGMDSIVLHDEPANRIRMFVVRDEHRLWLNSTGYKFSIAIHPHHCDVKLVPLFGKVENHVYALVPNAQGHFRQMQYRSAIKDGVGSLEPLEARASMHLLRSEGLPASLHAYELHTIYVPMDTEAAWLVIEGAEDPNYQPLCWTNDPEPDLSKLYQPMDAQAVEVTLRRVLSYMR